MKITTAASSLMQSHQPTTPMPRIAQMPMGIPSRIALARRPTNSSNQVPKPKSHTKKAKAKTGRNPNKQEMAARVSKAIGTRLGIENKAKSAIRINRVGTRTRAKKEGTGVKTNKEVISMRSKTVEALAMTKTNKLAVAARMGRMETESKSNKAETAT